MLMDEHENRFSDEDESGADEELKHIRKVQGSHCSKILDSIVSNLKDACPATQEYASALEKSQLYAARRDSSLGLILKQNHSNALLLLESMKPLPGDRLDVLFLMVECELRLKIKKSKHLGLTSELLQSQGVDRKDTLEWANNLAFPANRLVGWIHLFDIARHKTSITCSTLDEYAAWMASAAHEIGLKAYDVSRSVKTFDTMMSVVIRNMMKAWITSLRYVGNEKLKHISEIQCRVCSELCCSLGGESVFGGIIRLSGHYHTIASNYENPSLHKVYSFVLIAMATLKIHSGSVQDLKNALCHCQEGVKACEDALDFISPAEKNATILRLEELRRAATKIAHNEFPNISISDGYSTTI